METKQVVLVASDVVDIKHIFEAQDIANSGWNYTSF